jgi:hypothetical protein
VSGHTLLRAVVLVSALGMVLASCSGQSPEVRSSEDLEYVDPVEWLAQMCDVTAPVLPQVQDGYSRFVDGPSGAVGLRAMDGQTLREVDSWLNDSARLAADVAAQLERIGAPRTETGRALAMSQIEMYRDVAHMLGQAEELFDPSNLSSATEPGAILQGAGAKMVSFGETWRDVEPFNQPCPAQ